MLYTNTCGELNQKHIGKKVELYGWVDTVRAHGKITFIDLRDRYGKTQIIIKDKVDLKLEYVISVKGEVKARKSGTENKDLSTGDVEVLADKVEVISASEPLPFEIGSENVSEDIRLKYRYLDLRREKMQNNLEMRSKYVRFIQNFLDKENFVEIATPILTKSSPEGARDFLVPSRIHKGKFYALPQSPQQYKQLLMVSGFDKYFQIAPCFRDEDARAHRSPGEFYQLDLEMAFVKQNDILDVMERLIIGMVKELFPEKKFTKLPFPRLTYDEAMKKYKNDSPDIRKNKKDNNELGFCWVVDFPLFTRQSKDDFFHGAGKKWGPSHHMFTMPKEEHWKYLNDKDAGKANAYQHDMVLNGFEVGGGSIRIHKGDIQEKIFDLIGFSKEQKKYFSHMLTAFKYGVPPHGGIAIGVDRLLMAIMGEPSIRELIAFPKNKEARDVTFDAPSDVDAGQLKDVHIKLDVGKTKKGKK
tara:strand:- start:3186 stop:4598 length:1413 start_codon:yes stop_codon:yes gene_type:complete